MQTYKRPTGFNDGAYTLKKLTVVSTQEYNSRLNPRRHRSVDAMLLLMLVQHRRR